MTAAIRVGIVGCGKIAEVDHAPAYLAQQGLRIVALCDTNSSAMDRLQHACKLNEAQRHHDLKTFLKTPMDAVSICTPNHLHYAQSMAALKQGLHVLCDKPMAATSSQAQRMVMAAKKAKKILHVNQTLHYIPLYQQLVALVRQGKIGTVQHIRCLRAMGATPDIAWSPGASWFVSKACAGGIVLDIGVHMADLMRWIGGEVSEISATLSTRKPGIDVPDNLVAILRFEQGATGVLELSWTLPAGGGLLEVHGDKGLVRLGYSGDKPIEIIRPDSRGIVRHSYPKPKKRSRTSQQAFIQAIQGKAPSPTPGSLGRDAVALCEAISRSAQSGRFVSVKKFN